MNSTVDVAVVGATGMVGQSLFTLLEELDFPVGRLYPLASQRSKGKVITFKGKPVEVGDLAEFDFSKVSLAFFSAGGAISEKYVPIAAKAKCLCIDNTSTFRLDPKVPLVVPEVNAHEIEKWQDEYIIANPNCSTIQMVVALKPIHDLSPIVRVNVATYQAVSGAGKEAVDELEQQVQGSTQNKVFTQTIAYNAIPHIDVFMDNGYTKEEMKMVLETQKIMGTEAIRVNPTAVRIPVVTGHAEAVHLETQDKVTISQVREALKSSPGISVLDDREDGGYPTPRVHAHNQNPVFVGRIREDISIEHGINLWVVADNIRKGAALNSIQIAQHWLKLVNI